MNSIRFGESNYNSPYGKDSLQARTANFSTGAQSEVKKDSFNPKYKSKNNTASTIATIGIAVVGAVAAFKNRGKIKNVLSSLNKNKGEFLKGMKEKLPKGSTIKDALTSAKDGIKKPFVAAGNFITNIISKKK